MREITVGSKWRFATPSYLGGRPVVEVVEFNAASHQVKYQYPGLPVFCMERKSESFLDLYSEKVS